MELREYIAYARARISPVFTPEAEVRLVESYKELRRQCRNEGVSWPLIAHTTQMLRLVVNTAVLCICAVGETL